MPRSSESCQQVPTVAEVLPHPAPDQRHRARSVRWLAPASAVAVVLAVALVFVHNRQPGREVGAGNSHGLVAVQWQVQAVGGSRTAQQLTMQIEPNGRFAQNIERCASLQGQLTITATDLKIDDVRLSVGSCPADPTQTRKDTDQATDIARALRHMFSGTVSWSIESNHLTLHKDGVPTVVYSRSAQSPASVRQWTFRGVGISVPADWPVNAERCGTPTTNTVIIPHPTTQCLVPRPAGVTSVEFSVYDPSYDPFSSPPASQPATTLIDGVKATERMTAPQDVLQILEVQIPGQQVTITIASPSRNEVVQLESALYIVGS